MTTMIERVARALMEARGGCLVEDWSEAERNPNVAQAILEARAAIAAMREPTDAMLRAETKASDKWSADCYGAPLPAEDVWTTMIDTALEEGE